MSWNNTRYVCQCGTCVECVGEANRKGIYSAPRHVMFQWLESKSKKEEDLMAKGWMIIPCPKCRRDRQVQASSLKNGFSCDKCGYVTK